MLVILGFVIFQMEMYHDIGSDLIKVDSIFLAASLIVIGVTGLTK